MYPIRFQDNFDANYIGFIDKDIFTFVFTLDKEAKSLAEEASKCNVNERSKKIACHQEEVFLLRSMKEILYTRIAEKAGLSVCKYEPKFHLLIGQALERVRC